MKIIPQISKKKKTNHKSKNRSLKDNNILITVYKRTVTTVLKAKLPIAVVSLCLLHHIPTFEQIFKDSKISTPSILRTNPQLMTYPVPSVYGKG